MRRIKNAALNETIIVGTLQNGLKYSIIPKEHYKGRQVLLSVGAGARDCLFKTCAQAQTRGQTTVSVPLGTAHFLEHELFDEENGKSAFDTFALLGAYVNAYTTFNSTGYYFNCADRLSECASALFSFVETPCFTAEGVNSERQIIESEIRMYDDNPAWASYFLMLDCLYENNPAKNSIAGSVQSVSEITGRSLYDFYNAFYVPENICLICAGGFTDSELHALLDRAGGFMADKSFHKRAETVIARDTRRVFKKRLSKKMNIARPVLQIGIKDFEGAKDFADFEGAKDFADFAPSQTKRRACALMTLDLLIGEGSALNERLIKEGIISAAPSFDYVSGTGYGYAFTAAECEEPERFLEELLKTAENTAENGFNSGDFDRIKRKHIGRLIKSFNSIEALTLAQAELSHKNADLFDAFCEFEQMSVGDSNKALRDFFVQNGENIAMAVVSPK